MSKEEKELENRKLIELENKVKQLKIVIAETSNDMDLGKAIRLIFGNGK